METLQTAVWADGKIRQVFKDPSLETGKKSVKTVNRPIQVGDLVTKKVCVVQGAKWYVQRIDYDGNYAYVGKDKYHGDTLRTTVDNLVLVED